MLFNLIPEGVELWQILLDAYIFWIILFFLIRFLSSNKRMLNVAFAYLFIIGLAYVANSFDLFITDSILNYLVQWTPVFLIVVMAPDIRRSLEMVWKTEKKQDAAVIGSEKTKTSIVDAAMMLSANKIGALMTIEKHNTLEQYAERAIIMHSDVSKELLINIFTPMTPLHDGAVIIRGDKIICAGAYFVLSENANFEKTMGSRHRAGLGISEVSDSLTIIVSEETGSISIAVEGILLKINDRDKLFEYVNMFLK